MGGLAGFKGQAVLLMRLWTIVESGQIKGPLYNPAEHDSSMDNPRFVKEATMQLLQGAFPHVQPCVYPRCGSS